MIRELSIGSWKRCRKVNASGDSDKEEIKRGGFFNDIDYIAFNTHPPPPKDYI